MTSLFLCGRRTSRHASDLLLTADRDSVPAAWQVRQALPASLSPAPGALPYLVWRRRVPRPGHAITTADPPSSAGDWVLDFVMYARTLAGVPVEEPPTRRSVPADMQLPLIKPLFLELLDFLEQHDVPYWADSGTLLGAIRHGGIIPWDKDCDIGLEHDDRRRLADLIRKSRAGFGVAYDDQPTMWITSVKYGIRITDVFSYTRDRRFRAAFWREHARKYDVDLREGFLVHDQPVFRAMANQRFNIPWSLFHPVRRVPFYDRRIRVPARARTLLQGLYGDRCLTHSSTDNLNSDGAVITHFAPL
jgi:hypothetical protein